jgi:hypothetical protein
MNLGTGDGESYCAAESADDFHGSELGQLFELGLEQVEASSTGPDIGYGEVGHHIAGQVEDQGLAPG